jgi:hypothetical protein
MKNCPNCGSAIEPYKYKCEYCGTYYFDLASMFDMDNNKPCYIKFKTGNSYITALALPILESVETHTNTCDITGQNGFVLRTFNIGKEADINVRFKCLTDKETKSLFQVQVVE